MTLSERIEAFSILGDFFSQFGEASFTDNANPLNSKFYSSFAVEINTAYQHNGWFTKDNVLFSLKQWSQLLTADNLTQWTSNYDFGQENSKTIALIMAGNIPLVGFHDFLTVLISGHNVNTKLSSNDKRFFPLIAAMLQELNPGFGKRIKFSQDKLENYHAVIATGSNNTARYFNYYFKDYPSIIRQNRNSVAVLTGQESEDELFALSDDIFRYFGLGCRSVSKVFVPENYDFNNIFKAVFHHSDIVNHAKYANNYDYNKAVYLMTKSNLLDNGFFMIKEEVSYGSPIATLFYEYYKDLNSLEEKLQMDSEKIQITVAKEGLLNNSVNFGHSQSPSLMDYADGVDTMEFLLNLSRH